MGSPKPYLKVGIAGWSYPDWEGIVYSTGRTNHRLKFLCQFFSVIEINSTFYRTPTLPMVDTWRREVDDQPTFTFTVKLLKDFTHEVDPAAPSTTSLSKAARDFQNALAPLLHSNRLGAILIQFPYSFHATKKNFEYMKEVFKLFSGYPLVVEVRHRSFQSKEFFDFLREQRVGFANIDQPAVSYSLGRTSTVTSPVGYVRFHGRNARAWFDESAGRDQRYDYSYSQDELREWIAQIEKMPPESEVIYAIFNNHFRGQEVANALEFQHLWTLSPVRVPVLLKKSFPHLQSIALEEPMDATEKPHTLPLFPGTE